MVSQQTGQLQLPRSNFTTQISSTQIYASQSVFHLFYPEESLSIMKDGNQNELIEGKDLRKEKTSGNRAGSQENFLIY